MVAPGLAIDANETARIDESARAISAAATRARPMLIFADDPDASATIGLDDPFARLHHAASDTSHDCVQPSLAPTYANIAPKMATKGLECVARKRGAYG